MAKDRKSEEREIDYSLLGKFVYYYPPEQSGRGISAPLPNRDGTPHPAIIYNVHTAREDEDKAEPDPTMVDVRIWGNGEAYAVENIQLWDEGPLALPVAVFPEDDKERKRVTEEFKAQEAKEAQMASQAHDSANANMTKADLNDKTKDQLVDMADQSGVEASSSWTKDEIISAILKKKRAEARAAA